MAPDKISLVSLMIGSTRYRQFYSNSSHPLYLIMAKNYTDFVENCFNGALLTVYLYMLYPIATFQKAGTCLDVHQSMAKQPIKSCVSN